MILSFQETFVPAVVAGTKPHTIRAGQRWREGMSIQFYQNARQKSMAKIRPNDVARVVQEIKVEQPERYLGPPKQPIISIDGRQLTAIECTTLAHSDGFDSVEELVRFLAMLHSLPFTGQLIGWTDLRY